MFDRVARGAERDGLVARERTELPCGEGFYGPYHFLGPGHGPMTLDGWDRNVWRVNLTGRQVVG